MSEQTAEIKIMLNNGKEAGKTLNELTAQSVALNREIKRAEIGSDDWVKKTEDYKKINTRLKDVKKEIYSTDKAQKELEVGSDEWVKKTEEFNKINGRLKDVKQEISNTEKAQAFLNSTFMDMLPFNAQIQSFAGTFGKLNTGVKATTLSTNLFKTALAATGIGLIIIALGTLFTWLSKTQQGMDFVAKAGDAVRAVFQVVIDRVLTFAGAMKDLISGNFGAALDGMKNTFSGIGEEIVKDTKEAWKLSGALQDITREEKALDLQRAKSRATIEQLKLVAEDQTKSTEERAAAASKALAMEQDLMEKSIQLQERKVQAIKAQNDMGTSTDDDINRAIDAEIELANLREESTTKQIELNNKLNELRRSDGAAATAALKEKQAAETKAHEERLKAQEELAKKIIEADKTLQDQRVAMITDEQDRKIAEINLATERELAAFEGSETQKTEFLKLKQQERDAAIDAIIEENNKKAAEKNLARLEEQNLLEEEKVFEMFFNKLISEEERNEQLYELQAGFIERKLALLAAAGSTEILEYQKLYTELAELHYNYESEKTKKTEQEQQARQDLEMKSLEAAGSVFAGFADLLAKDEEAKRKNWKVIKTLKKAELLSNLPVEISAIWKRAADLGPIFGPIVGAAQTILAGARFVQASAQLDAVKFAKGGPVFGPSHQAGGIPFSVRGKGGYEMEGGETILAKGVYANPVLRNIASQINEMGGGRRFALGGPVLDRPMVGPSERRSAPQQLGATAPDMGETNAYLRQIAVNTEKAANTPPPISLQKVRSGLELLQDIEADART